VRLTSCLSSSDRMDGIVKVEALVTMVNVREVQSRVGWDSIHSGRRSRQWVRADEIGEDGGKLIDCDRCFLEEE
jgi:hypothetical protein